MIFKLTSKMKMQHQILAIISVCLIFFSQSGMAEFIFAHINESIMLLDRGEKYEDPLDVYLKKNNIGEVTGGGSSLS